MSYRHDTIVYDPDEDVWAPVWNAPKYYISETGHVWGPGRYGRGQLLTPTPDRTGHLYVSMVTRDGIIREYVHRLVAEAFIPNPNNYPLVRHLDDYPDNNCVWNLAWGTTKDNAQDAIRNGRAYCIDQQIPVRAIDLRNGSECDFKSQADAARTLGVSSVCISRVLNGKQAQTGGYTFVPITTRTSDYKNINHKNTYSKIRATNLETGLTRIYNSQQEAESILGIGSRMINRVLKGYRPHTHGYSFEYLTDRRND